MLLTSYIREALLESSLPIPMAPTATLRQRLYREAVSLAPPGFSTLRGAAEWWTLSDEELLADWLQGDASAFESLMERHLGRMQAWARRHLPPAEADDATQEAFLALLHKGAELRLDGSLRGYLFGLVRIAVLRAHRGLARRRGEPLEEEGDASSVLLDSGPNPEVALLTRRSYEELAEALQSVCTLREQEVILFTLEGTDDRTIAEALETTEGNVRVLRYRALGKLRQALKKEAEAGRPGVAHGH